MFGCKCKFLYQRSKWTMLQIGNVSNRFFSTRPSLIIEFFSPQGASTTCKSAQRYKKQEFWKISCTDRWSSACFFLLLNEKFGVNICTLLANPILSSPPNPPSPCASSTQTPWATRSSNLIIKIRILIFWYKCIRGLKSIECWFCYLLSCFPWPVTTPEEVTTL